MTAEDTAAAAKATADAAAAEATKKAETDAAAKAAADAATAAKAADDKKAADEAAAVIDKKSKGEETLLPKERIAEIVAFAKEQNLTPAQTRAIMDGEDKSVLGYKAQLQKQFDTAADGWIETAKKHPEYGGESFAANMEACKRLMDKYASPELKKILGPRSAEGGTDYGNHPEFLGFVYKLAKAAKEDNFFATPAAVTNQKPKSNADVFQENTAK